MDIGTELLRRYMVALVDCGVFSKDGYSPTMQACMLLERIASELMDEVDSASRLKISNLYSSAIARTLAAGGAGRNL